MLKLSNLFYISDCFVFWCMQSSIVVAIQNSSKSIGALEK